MNQLDFEHLCRDTSLALDIRDTGALGEGFTMEFAGVLFETAFREGRDVFLLMAEVGAVAPECREKVFENLFTIQLMTWNRPGLRFGFNPRRDTVVLTIEVRLAPACDGDWLATVIRSVASQAVEWRSSLLSGPAVDAHSDDLFGEGAREFLAPRHHERTA